MLQGVVASGIAFAVQIWCIDRGGPVFVAVYQPVQTFVVAIMASLALGEEFYLGGLVLINLLNYNLVNFLMLNHNLDGSQVKC
jgi:drug/metabolite transporter (DMT)-like permease